MFKMTHPTYNSLVFGLLLFQLIKSQNRFCPEAVSSMKRVAACPTSKTEWDNAALKKNCSELAPSQNCAPVNKFKYHCVINGLRNKLVEVCAPERIIFGHCVEFNGRGGVIQDQKSAVCNEKFPKCDIFYFSTDAYKYSDCYMLVSSVGLKDEATFLITKSISAKLTTMRTTTDESLSSQTVIIITTALSVVFIVCSAVVILVILVLKKRRMTNEIKMDESEEAMLGEINIKHDERDDKENIEKEGEARILLNSNNTDDEEMLEREDELRTLLNSTHCRNPLMTSHLRRIFSTNEFPTCKTKVLIDDGLRRNYSALF